MNSKEVKEGYLFFAIKGSSFDGHEFIEEAVKRGAIAVVAERKVGISKELPVFVVEDTRKSLGECARLYYGSPSEFLKVVGITGTNGKTTTSYILESVISSSGHKCGLVGTVEYRLGSTKLGSGRTTPDQITWHRTLSELLKMGADWVVTEVSSHALDQSRVYGTDFHGVIFTNLSQDHLDYHKDMEDYFLSKRKLFTEYESQLKVVNADDPYGKRLAEELGDEAITYGREGKFKILEFATSFKGSVLRLGYGNGSIELKTNLIGDFQAYNLAGAVAYLLSAGFSEREIREGVKSVNVPGRFETYDFRDFIVVVDYAHTPDALENLLKTANRLKRNRVITLFGAGGNRDRQKRPLMGNVAERLSDLVILTSDNPRWEEPEDILEDILKGIKNRDKVIVEPDRKEAIELAIREAKDGDVVLIAGKGHEDYQEIKGIKYPFSDREMVKSLLSGGKYVL